MAEKNNPAEVFRPRSREIRLKRVLNLIQTLFLGVGTAIGGVMFVIMGRAVELAGPSIILTFLIGSVFALLIGICYAELGATVPSGAGGAISFVARAFGDSMPTFVAGWFDWIGSITDCTIGAVVFSFSVNYFFNWIEPFSLAVITLIVFTIINFRGAKTMGIAQFILTLVLILTLSIFISGAFLNFEVSRFQPFFPNGWLPTILLVSYIFPTYAGYETITQLSEEVKIAGKTIPRALFLTLAIITILFTGSAIALVGGAPPEVYFGSNTPLQNAANYFMGPIGGAVVSVGSIFATLTTINGSLGGGTRIAYALSRRKLLPPLFSRVHPKFNSPYTALALTALIAIIFVLTRSIDFIVYAIALGNSVTAIMVCLALIRLRKSEPLLFRPYKVPLFPVVPIAAVAVLVLMIATLSIESLLLGLVFGLIGIGLLTMAKRHNRQQSQEQKPQTA
jgi:APA family basic amino acid/polyamine antiporter